MTIEKLSKILAILVKAGHGRKKVYVNKRSFHHNCESDGAVILDVMRTSFRKFPMFDEDGGLGFRKDGTERTRTGIIFIGSLDE